MVSVTHDGFTVETNTGDEASVRASMGVEPEAQESGEHDEAADQVHAGTPANQPVDQESDGTTPATDESGGRPAKKTKPRDNPQARIAQEIEKRKAVESRASQLEAELAALKATPAKVEPPKQPDTTARAKPKEDEVGTKYASYADFIEDLADWKAEQRIGALKPANVDELVEQKLSQREQQRRESEVFTAHRARVEEIRETHDDYDERVTAADEALRSAGLSLSAAASQAIITSDHSASLVYWLATHPDQYLQLARDTQSLDVVAAPLVRQLLEARLGAVATPGSAHAANISRAKPPIKPVGASPVASLPEDPSDDESFDKYFARENARDRKAGRL